MSNSVHLLVAFLMMPPLFGCARVRALIGVEPPGGRDPAYYFLLSQVESHEGDPSKALDLLNRAIEKDPNQSYLWYKRASLLASQGDLKKAEEDLLRALELSPEEIEVLVLLGRVYQTGERRKEAIAAFRKALQIDPASEEVNSFLLDSYIAVKDYKAVMGLVKNWEKEDLGNVIPLFYEAWLYRNFFGNQPMAISVYRKILSLDPDNLKARSALAEIYMARKEHRKVLDIFKEMEALEPNDPSLRMKMALLYYEHKQFDRAIEKFEEVLKTHPEADRVIYYLGVIYENVKRDHEAIVQFQKITPASSFFKDARLHTAFLLVRGGKGEEAIRLLTESIRTKPEIGAFYEYLAEIHRDRHEEEKAIGVLKKGLSKSPDQESLHYSLGMAYDRTGRFEDCVRSMRRVLETNPQNANAMNYIGYSYADRGINLDEALELIQKALALKPDDGYITDSLGWAYFRKGDIDQAMLHIQKAYRLVPNEPTVTEHLGDLWLEKKEVSKALRYFREALLLLEKKKEGDVAKDLDRVRKKIGDLLK